MSEEAWARHANPWSGWTRIVTALPLLIVTMDVKDRFTESKIQNHMAYV
ncbi:MAG: hypothetical protein MUD14_09270 [Hydrococcus sp. Prado102]|jgi:hypothetical protein|nr:hypothetical protein [Hydrococcus sp. Prado102]